MYRLKIAAHVHINRLNPANVYTPNEFPPVRAANEFAIGSGVKINFTLDIFSRYALFLAM
jgi:hypothetical protein